MPKIAKRTKIAEEPCSLLTWIRRIQIWFRLLLCHFFVMKLFCYEIQLCKEFAEVCIFCGSFIINSFWTHLSYVLKTGRRLFWKNEAKVRKRAWFISSCVVKLEMAKKVHFQMSKIGEKHWLVSSMTFRFPFHLLVLFYNKYFSQVSILKSCWPIHFQIISPTSKKNW